MKVTITCRFTFLGIEMDNKADCRCVFLLEKWTGRWSVVFFYMLLFDKVDICPQIVHFNLRTAVW